MKIAVEAQVDASSMLEMESFSFQSSDNHRQHVIVYVFVRTN